MQTRAFDTDDRNTTVRTVIATLQDLCFVVDKADVTLGTVSATKLDGYAMRMTVTVRALQGKGRPSGLGPEAQVEEQVEAQVGRLILETCARHPLSSGEIAAALGHRKLSGNIRKALPALREAGLLEYTIPDKPNSRLQKYRLTRN